jgi:hypothetical protein
MDNLPKYENMVSRVLMTSQLTTARLLARQATEGLVRNRIIWHGPTTLLARWREARRYRANVLLVYHRRSHYVCGTATGTATAP